MNARIAVVRSAECPGRGVRLAGVLIYAPASFLAASDHPKGVASTPPANPPNDHDRNAASGARNCIVYTYTI
jgi:hypothetical protein